MTTLKDDNNNTKIVSNKDKAVDINYVQEKYTLTEYSFGIPTKRKLQSGKNLLKLIRQAHTNTHLLWSGNEIEFTLTSFYYN